MGDDQGERIAPVIPLFGAAAPAARSGRPDRAAGASEPPATRRFRVDDGAAPVGEPSSAAADEAWHTTWRDLGRERRRPEPAPELSTVERGGVRFVEVAARAVSPEQGGGDAPPDAAELAAGAERKLLRSLGSRGLSVSEARTKLRHQEVPAELIDDIVDRLVRTGALDDARLAEQVVHAATSRKKQGRRAIARSLSARGIPREVIDEALEELPDDDAERALEFARSKAGQLSRFDEDTALRRLVGQLARRGFGGSLAMSAARRALDEARRPTGGVRFE